MYFPTNKINTHDDTHTHKHIFQKKQGCAYIYIYMVIHKNEL